jgi:putative transposase
MSRAERRALVERADPALPVTLQCRLLAVSRASVYRRPAEVSDADRAIMALIDRQYLARPYYGSRRMAAWLATQGHRVNRKRVQRLMRLMGLVAIYQRPNTSKPAPGSKVYPYLLGGLQIERANQVWCADITYIPMAKGFLYLVVVMDWVSRAVLAWRLSNTLGAEFCVEALEEALAQYGRPEIFNTDQGCQFTSNDFIGVLERGGITISMDGKGRCMDNIFVERLWRSLKYEEVYLHAYASVAEAKVGIAAWLRFPTRNGSIRASATARRGKSTRKACGYVDARLCRPAALPPLPEQARKAGKCSPAPTYPQAPQPTRDLILMR